MIEPNQQQYKIKQHTKCTQANGAKRLRNKHIGWMENGQLYSYNIS